MCKRDEIHEARSLQAHCIIQMKSKSYNSIPCCRRGHYRFFREASLGFSTRLKGFLYMQIIESFAIVIQSRDLAF